ncbi:ATP-binding cassette domain-containing protein [Paenibacillus sp. HJL G12]|uniref:ATP-binding cassette domain-containing protein n=1 Tax=Paenibacillus dendrobii TaxID=2691084 RepID=A0A7X3IGD3_9BACL|nr:ATP-binding cassette domain-containing protein [Paenibacillus dendrobii]MWV42781.1 ATP-binding cassette domain-containing protein [Paenibacillus dendrobii]
MVYELKHVSVNYDERAALQNVTCTIREGKWISIIGRAGAGKSTFVKVLKGLIPDFNGDYRINRQPISRDSKGRVKVVPDIGFVFQYPEHQIFETSVYKELAFAPKMQGESPHQIAQAIELILPQVGLPKEILPYAPFQLSGGQKRRLAIASVLLMNPKLLILDEPTAGLDPLSRMVLLKMLKEWQRQHNRTILFISHHMDDVAEYSDEVMVFRAGQLLGHVDANTLFLEKSELLEQVGLPLPESVQLLKLVEELSGEKIKIESCREQVIFREILPIWHARGISDGE